MEFDFTNHFLGYNLIPDHNILVGWDKGMTRKLIHPVVSSNEIYRFATNFNV